MIIGAVTAEPTRASTNDENPQNQWIYLRNLLKTNENHCIFNKDRNFRDARVGSAVTAPMIMIFGMRRHYGMLYILTEGIL